MKILSLESNLLLGQSILLDGWFLEVFLEFLRSMGLREVKVTGFQLRVVLRNHLSGRCLRVFS